MFGPRLRLARKRAGLSMRALASQMSPKVSAQAIRKYETGKMLPSSAVLVGLGNTLGVSLDFLMSSQVESLDGLDSRRHFHSSARDRARAEAFLIDHLERHLAIERILDLPRSTDWAREFRPGDIRSESDTDSRTTYARSWRKEEPESIRADDGLAAFGEPHHFKRLVWRALAEELISPVRASALLGEPLDAVEREISGPLVQ